MIKPCEVTAKCGCVTRAIPQCKYTRNIVPVEDCYGFEILLGSEVMTSGNCRTLQEAESYCEDWIARFQGNQIKFEVVFCPIHEHAQEMYETLHRLPPDHKSYNTCELLRKIREKMVRYKN